MTSEVAAEESPPDPHAPSTPSTSHRQPTTLKKDTEVAILMDSNSRYIQEQKLFPNKKVSKIWCPTTEDALQILSDPEFGTPGQILIHTGTNNLREEPEIVGTLVTSVAEKAAASFPNARITISTLLPRRDFHPKIINRVNTDIARGCSSLPNVHVAHHPSITPEHLSDHCHLREQAVGMFTKTLKDVALGRLSLHLTPTRVPAREPPRHPPRPSYAPDPARNQRPPRHPPRPNYAPDPVRNQRSPRHPPRPSTTHRPPPPPQYHHLQQQRQTGPDTGYHPSPNQRLYQNQEPGPQTQSNRSPQHQQVESHRAPHTYTEALQGRVDREGMSEIKQLLQYICTKLI